MLQLTLPLLATGKSYGRLLIPVSSKWHICEFKYSAWRKKLFLKRERTAQAPSISREEPEEVVASFSRNNHVSEIREQLPFMFFDET